MMWWK